jgi:hypothetical protein
VFFAKALRSSAFETFWRTYPYVNNKRWVIRNGEITRDRAEAIATMVMRGNALKLYNLGPTRGSS